MANPEDPNLTGGTPPKDSEITAETLPGFDQFLDMYVNAANLIIGFAEASGVELEDFPPGIVIITDLDLFKDIRGLTEGSVYNPSARALIISAESIKHAADPNEDHRYDLSVARLLSDELTHAASTKKLDDSTIQSGFAFFTPSSQPRTPNKYKFYNERDYGKYREWLGLAPQSPVKLSERKKSLTDKENYTERLTNLIAEYLLGGIDDYYLYDKEDSGTMMLYSLDDNHQRISGDEFIFKIDHSINGKTHVECLEDAFKALTSGDIDALEKIYLSGRNRDGSPRIDNLKNLLGHYNLTRRVPVQRRSN